MIVLISICILCEIAQLLSFSQLSAAWHGYYQIKDADLDTRTSFVVSMPITFLWAILIAIVYWVMFALVLLFGLISFQLYALLGVLAVFMISLAKFKTYKKSLKTFRIFYVLDSLVCVAIWVLIRYTL